MGCLAPYQSPATIGTTKLAAGTGADTPCHHAMGSDGCKNAHASRSMNPAGLEGGLRTACLLPPTLAAGSRCGFVLAMAWRACAWATYTCRLHTIADLQNTHKAHTHTRTCCGEGDSFGSGGVRIGGWAGGCRAGDNSEGGTRLMKSGGGSSRSMVGLVAPKAT
eukprot:scaffold301875_cov19-Tisochrysis_lutea.AAC.1